MGLLLPNDTVDVVGQLTARDSNWQPSLRLDKFLPDVRQRNVKGDFLKELIAGRPPKYMASVLQQYQRRTTTLVGRLCEQGRPSYAAVWFEAEVLWRMVLGLGTAHALETSMALHRLLGFPYIPGSAAKGLARSYATLRIAEDFGIRDLERLDQSLLEGNAREQRELVKKLNPNNVTALTAAVAQFQKVFGTTSRQGLVIFFDALPVQVPTLEMDIMNPHYSGYYADGKKPPSDTSSPIPVPFLTVSRGTRFRFHLAAQDPALLGAAEGWLQAAVGELGVGAKTRAGYGELKVVEVEDPTQDLERKIRQ